MGSELDIEHLDEGIAPIVKLFIESGIKTFESCEGGDGHEFQKPIVRFLGNRAEGFKAYAIAIFNGYKVSELRRYWVVEDGDLTGPRWEMTFVPKPSPR